MKTGTAKERIRKFKILSSWTGPVPAAISQEQVGGRPCADIDFPCGDVRWDQRKVSGSQGNHMPARIHINAASQHRYPPVPNIQRVMTGQHMGHP